MQGIWGPQILTENHEPAETSEVPSSHPRKHNSIYNMSSGHPFNLQPTTSFPQTWPTRCSCAWALLGSSYERTIRIDWQAKWANFAHIRFSPLFFSNLYWHVLHLLALLSAQGGKLHLAAVQYVLSYLIAPYLLTIT